MSFPPGIVVAVKALACELPSELGLPLSRFSMSEIKQEVVRRGLVLGGRSKPATDGRLKTGHHK